MVYLCTGRCSHVCNAGFLTTVAARGRGVGIVMGETYLQFAPKLVSSLFFCCHYLVFMYVYDGVDCVRATNTPSLTWSLRIMLRR